MSEEWQVKVQKNIKTRQWFWCFFISFDAGTRNAADLASLRAERARPECIFGVALYSGGLELLFEPVFIRDKALQVDLGGRQPVQGRIWPVVIEIGD